MKNDSFEELLRKLSAELNNLNAPILKKLNKGVMRQEVSARLEERWFPEEVFQLYSWHDGTNLDDDDKIGAYWLFKMGTFMSSSRAIQCHKKKSGQDSYWGHNKFPLFESRGGDFFLIDNDETSPTSGMIFFHSIGAVDFDTIISKYDSLETLFKTILECFQQDAYRYNNTTYIFEFDPELEKSISKKYNPKSQFWML